MSETISYEKMLKYIAERDYIFCDRQRGIDFYTPNDEDWGGIVAVHHPAQLIMYTSFFEVEDMIPPSDYEVVVSKGELKFKFQTES